MYDDNDYRSRDRDSERDQPYRRRSPSFSRGGGGGQPQYRSSRHDSSRSPRRTTTTTTTTTPPNGPRAADRDRDRDRYGGYSDRDRPSLNHQPEDYGSGYDRETRDYGDRDSRYRRRDSHGYGKDGRPSDRDWDRDRTRDYRGRYDSRDRGRRSPRDGPPPDDDGEDGYYRDGGYRSGPGKPYHTIKMDGIPEDMSSQEVEDALRSMGAASLVDVRIKLDDRSGDRRCYAFAEFKSDEDAIDFLERHYPTLEFTAANGSTVRIPLAYSRERRHASNPDDWQCTMCHFENFSRRATCKQCKAPRPSEDAAEMHLDGSSDENPQQTPSQFLVVRNLPSSVSEAVLATGIKKLYVAKEDAPKSTNDAHVKLKSTAPVGNTTGLGAKPGSLARVFMIREKHSEVTLRYGIAEFATIDDAKAAMAKFNASPQFTISSKPVTIAYIHSGVFIPYFNQITEQDRKFTFTASHNPSLRLSYWNPSVYANEFTVFNEGSYEEKPSEKAASDANSSTKDSKKRKAEKELTAPGGKKAIAMAPQLQMWANKHAELHGGAKKDPSSVGSEEKGIPATGANSLGTSPTMLSSAPSPSPTPSTTSSAVSYADLDRMCCLLCRRKFISEPSLRRHEQLSDLHKKNLDDASLIAKAVAELKVLGMEPTSNSNYRDRAKERRMAHNQPRKPRATNLPRKHPQSQSQHPAQATKESTPESGKPSMSKGAGLLAKMGWSTGSGLGAEGEGRTNVIETMAYAPGVGLGAEGGKIGDAAEEAERSTRNEYSDFVGRVKDKARERYERMS